MRLALILTGVLIIYQSASCCCYRLGAGPKTGGQSKLKQSKTPSRRYLPDNRKVYWSNKKNHLVMEVPILISVYFPVPFTRVYNSRLQGGSLWNLEYGRPGTSYQKLLDKITLQNRNKAGSYMDPNVRNSELGDAIPSKMQKKLPQDYIPKSPMRKVGSFLVPIEEPFPTTDYPQKKFKKVRKNYADKKYKSSIVNRNKSDSNVKVDKNGSKSRSKPIRDDDLNQSRDESSLTPKDEKQIVPDKSKQVKKKFRNKKQKVTIKMNPSKSDSKMKTKQTTATTNKEKYNPTKLKLRTDDSSLKSTEEAEFENIDEVDAVKEGQGLAHVNENFLLEKPKVVTLYVHKESTDDDDVAGTESDNEVVNANKNGANRRVKDEEIVNKKSGNRKGNRKKNKKKRLRKNSKIRSKKAGFNKSTEDVSDNSTTFPVTTAETLSSSR